MNKDLPVIFSEFLLNLNNSKKLKELIVLLDDDMKDRLIDSIKKMYDSNTLEVPIEDIVNIIFDTDRAKSETKRLEALKISNPQKGIMALETLRGTNKNKRTQIKVLHDLLIIYSARADLENLRQVYDELESLMIAEDED